MLRFLIIEILLPLLVFLVIRAVFKSLIGSSSRPAKPRRPDPPTVETGGELKRDPVCGTYVSTTASVSRTVAGQTIYFCSKECRDRYRAG
jgi:YHS domain-containing protein